MHVAAVYYFLFSYVRVKYCRGKIKLRCFSTSYSLNLSFPVFTRGISSHLSDYAIIPLNGHRTRIFSTVDGSVSWHALWKYQRTSLILCTLAVLMVNSCFLLWWFCYNNFWQSCIGVVDPDPQFHLTSTTLILSNMLLPLYLATMARSVGCCWPMHLMGYFTMPWKGIKWKE